MKTTMLMMLSLMFAGAAANANAAEVDGLLRQMQTTRGADYLAARNAAVDAARGEPAQLSAARAATVTKRSWRKVAFAEIAHAWTFDRATTERAYVLEGVDPALYLKDRVAVPTVSAELVRKQIPAGALFELWLRTSDDYPFAAREAYPAHVSAEDFASLRRRERASLRQGVLVAIGHSKHASAPYLLAEVLADVTEDDETRQAAASALGDTASPIASEALTKVFADRRQSESLRAAALSGLGQVRDDTAFATLTRVATDARASKPLKHAAIAGLGAYATRSARARIGAKQSDRAALALVELLKAGAGEHETTVVEGLGRSASPAALAALQGVEGEAAARARARLSRRIN